MRTKDQHQSKKICTIMSFLHILIYINDTYQKILTFENNKDKT